MRFPHRLARPTRWRTLRRAYRLSGLAPSDRSSGSDELALSLHNFRDVRQHGLRMRVEDIVSPSGD